MSLRHVLGIVGISLALPGRADAQAQGKFPTAEEVQEWLRKEPITEASWPAWRQRLTNWFGDRSRQTDAAYRAAEQFSRAQAEEPARLPPKYDHDHLAWYFLGGACMNARPASPPDLEYAETAYRRSVAI